MAQGVLPFNYESEKKTTGMTAQASLPVYLVLTRVTGLSKSIEKHLKVRKGGQGWTDSQVVLSLALLNLAGGDCLDDIKILEAEGRTHPDEGLNGSSCRMAGVNESGD